LAIQEVLDIMQQRAESLTVMYLTRRDDLIVLKQKKDKDYILDFLVTITKGSVNSGRLFGIEVKATASRIKSIGHDDVVEIKLKNNQIDFFAELPFPVCLFFFTPENDHGYYKWILQPVIADQHNPKLHFERNNDFKKLTDEEINKIIDVINIWYDNRK